MFDPLKSKTRVLIYTALTVTLGLGGASALGWTSLSAMPAIRQDPVLTDEQIQPALDLSEAFINISEAVTPAVVRIEAERTAQVAFGGTDSQIPEQFREFFGPFNQQPQDSRPVLSGGSGFIISPDGYILTNNHVVANANRLTVFLRDRREYSAEVIGTDPTTDVAIIKIEDAGLPTLSLGTSDDVRVGEWVLAVGNPGFGGGSSLDYTVTSGIISAIGRPLEGLIDGEIENEALQGFGIESFLQTDAVINPGNSGGPLVNLRGQVVGINSAIASQTGYYQGYGFAIPIDLAERVTEDLIEFGEVRRAYLGIRMVPVSSVDAEYYGLPRTMGARIEQAVEGSPAADAGLRQEDVVVAVEGTDIDLPSDLQLLIAQRRPGDQVEVVYYRDQERRETTIRLGTAPLAAAAPAPEVAAVSSQARIGIDVLAIGPTEAEQYGFNEPGGVVIGGVSPAGPALRAGVIPGEKLLAVNREPVETVDDVEALLGSLSPGDIVSLRLGLPDESSRIVNLRVPE